MTKKRDEGRLLEPCARGSKAPRDGLFRTAMAISWHHAKGKSMAIRRGEGDPPGHGEPETPAVMHAAPTEP